MIFKPREYTTESGRKAVVTAIDVPGRYPVLGYIINEPLPPDVALWDAEGRHALGGDGLQLPSLASLYVEAQREACAEAGDGHSGRWNFRYLRALDVRGLCLGPLPSTLDLSKYPGPHGLPMLSPRPVAGESPNWADNLTILWKD